MEGAVELLGAPRHRLEGAATPLPHEAPLWLLAFLACHDGRVTREEVVGVFYPETGDGAARNRLRNLLHRIRALAWGGGLDADADGLRWAPDLDVRRFRRACASGDWAEALTVYGGPLLDGTRPSRLPEFELWLEAEREDLQTAWQEAVMNHAAALERLDRFAEALPWLERLLAANPLAEEAVRAHLRCAARCGRREEAAQVFARFRARLRQELGLEPEAATLRLYAALPEAPAAIAPRPRRSAGTPFFGREEELASLSVHLASPEQRLLTLCGFGGVGKTRLALEALESARDTFGDAVSFVPLEGADSASALVSAIAAALGLKLSGNEAPLAQVLALLGTKRHLLALDNFEQLLAPAVREEALGVLLALLKDTEGVTLLVTSRQRLGLQTEWVFSLGGLPYPGGPDLAAAARSSAVRLFVERAGRARPGFALGGENVAALVEICQLVEGLPLALELAAAWAGSLAPPDIAAELGAVLDLAGGEALDRPQRHRSLRAACAYSWRLLTPEEGRTLARLSVFRGGFERTAALRVGSASLRVLLSLADKSLLRRDAGGRFALHEVVRQYAAEQLQAAGEEEAARGAHAAFFLNLAEEAAPQLRGPEQARALERLAAEHDNLRAALAWAFEADASTALRLAAALHWFWYVRGHHREGYKLLEEALALPGARGASRAAALYGAGWLARELGDYAASRTWLNEALALCQNAGQDLGDRARAAEVLHALGLNCREVGELDEAQELLARAETVQREVGDAWGLASSLNDLGITRAFLRDGARARQYFEESLHLKEAIGDRQGVAYALANLGNVAENSADYRALTERSLAIKRELNDRQGIANSLCNLGEISLEEADLGAARTLLGEALELYWQLGRKRSVAIALVEFAKLCAAEHRPDACLRLAGAADALIQAGGFQLHAADTQGARNALGPAADAIYRQGQALRLEEAVEQALRPPPVPQDSTPT